MTAKSGDSREFAVSVVVSTHNRQADLREALGSVLNQAGEVPYEVLIVDNNSTDDTRAVVERAIASSPVPLKYLFEPRQGVSYGRNTGILHARAPIVAITDDDCRPAADWIASIVQAFEKYPDADCIGGRVVPAWPDHVPSWFTELQASPLAICEHGDEDLPVDAGHAALCLLTANLAVRRSVFDKVGMFSTEYPRGQDREIQLRMWRAGCRGLYVPGVVVKVPIPPERLNKQVLSQMVSQVWPGARASGTARQSGQEWPAREPTGGLTVVRHQSSRASHVGVVRPEMGRGDSAAARARKGLPREPHVLPWQLHRNELQACARNARGV